MSRPPPTQVRRRPTPAPPSKRYASFRPAPTHARLPWPVCLGDQTITQGGSCAAVWRSAWRTPARRRAADGCRQVAGAGVDALDQCCTVHRGRARCRSKAPAARRREVVAAHATGMPPLPTEGARLPPQRERARVGQGQAEQRATVRVQTGAKTPKFRRSTAPSDRRAPTHGRATTAAGVQKIFDSRPMSGSLSI
ncbi:hypothetical protein BU14_0127s0047 [Porphyra umbilicalis]|uniref:Uncharacterized protein n=1 Tax=Porphyra umbilicalis TaxID=2786 RepID=A0A1X6PAM9_PORUM|nr:hypothetical protein BU14_0127s0047 [Porphyra umbilicalis]|eukprot:OSX77951.1 hypothetical protein BU14_0127s0047 [Porphyra umbilicalis]